MAAVGVPWHSHTSKALGLNPVPAAVICMFTLCLILCFWSQSEDMLVTFCLQISLSVCICFFFLDVP